MRSSCASPPYAGAGADEPRLAVGPARTPRAPAGRRGLPATAAAAGRAASRPRAAGPRHPRTSSGPVAACRARPPRRGPGGDAAGAVTSGGRRGGAASWGTVILAFDVSTSMAAKDMQPSRLDAAKAAARGFVEKQPSTVKIGVVAFGGNGIIAQQPTTDKDQVLASFNRLAPQGETSSAAASSRRSVPSPASRSSAAATPSRAAAARRRSATTAGRPSSSSPTERTRADRSRPSWPTWPRRRA